MGVIVGIDYGTKRIGLATTDSKQIIASGLCTLSKGKVIKYLKDYLEQISIDLFVVGYPRKLNGKDSDVEKSILVFIEELQKNFQNIPVVRQEERFTSKIAFNCLIEVGAKKKIRNNKGLLDKISATLILQSFLESNSKPIS